MKSLLRLVKNRVSSVTESSSGCRRQNSTQECILEIALKPIPTKLDPALHSVMLSDELSATKNAHIARRK
jgi:hypothetical protein